MRRRPLPVLALVSEGMTSAVDALQSSPRRTGLTVAAVAASVCVVLVAGAASSGIATRLERDARTDGARGFVVYPRPGIQRGRPLGSAEARALGSLPEVAGAAAHLAVALPVRAGGRLVSDVAIDAYDNATTVLQDADLLRGRWLTATDQSRAAAVVVVNDGLTARLAPRGTALGARIDISRHPFRVVGVYHDGDAAPHAIIPLDAARRVLGVSASWADVVVRTRDGVPIQAATEAARARLRRERGTANDAPADFIVAGADRLRAGSRVVPLLARLTAGSLVSLGLTVTGIALFGIMTVSVRDRVREIGLRKVLGATRAAIVIQFVVESATLAALGGVVGLAAGRAIAMLVAGATPIPASVSGAAAVTTIGLTLVAGAALGAPPAVRAARRDVLHALRGE